MAAFNRTSLHKELATLHQSMVILEEALQIAQLDHTPPTPQMVTRAYEIKLRLGTLTAA